uniref:VP2 protein n=1 Tax=Chaerephon bat polyomavirus TaxID=3141916 RepID=A0AAU7E2Z5_9POLY
MGIVVSIVAAVAAGVAEAAADAAAVATAAAGAAADAVASGMELVGSIGEAAGDTVPLLEEREEETIFDASTYTREARDAAYADEGAVNDPWNWEEADGVARPRVSRAAIGTTLAAIGAGAGIATGLGLAAATKTTVGQEVLQGGQNITQALEEDGFPELSSSIPDSVLSFMAPEEYELACKALEDLQTHGGFSPDTLEEAENAVVYADPQGRLPFAEKDPSLLFDVATSGDTGPWFLPGAAGQPLTRGMLARARAAREVMERGQAVSRGFQLSSELRNELRRTGRALDRVYNEVLNRQPVGAPPAEEVVRRILGQARDIALEQGLEAGAGAVALDRVYNEVLNRQPVGAPPAEEVVRRILGQARDIALEQGLEAGAGAVANVLGGGAIASTLAGLTVAGGKYLWDQFTGPALPPGSVQIENNHYDDAPWYVRAFGGLWKKQKASYIVEEGGTLGTITIGYYAPEQTVRGLPSTEPWFHFPKRDPDQLRNLEFWLRNNWGGNHTYLGLSVEGNFVIGDLVLQEALYRRRWVKKTPRHASAKRRPRDPKPSARPKRARRARN